MVSGPLRLMIAVVGLVVALAPGVGSAAPSQRPSRQAIADAKASMLDGADEAFMAAWSQGGEQMTRDGITASGMRAISRWAFLARMISAPVPSHALAAILAQDGGFLPFLEVRRWSTRNAPLRRPLGP